MYIGLTLIWAVLNTFALEVIAFIDVISIWWQVKLLTKYCLDFDLLVNRVKWNFTLVVLGCWGYGYCDNASACGTKDAIRVLRVHQVRYESRANWDFKQAVRGRSVVSRQPVLSVWIRRCGASNRRDQRRRQERPHRDPV